jgi:uncharacterized protein YbjT (DUF2867 family)
MTNPDLFSGGQNPPKRRATDFTRLKEAHMSEKVLVIGATGKTGSELVNLFIQNGKTVRAATRNPSTVSSKFPRSVEFVEFDYDRPQTFAPALTGVEKLFLMARPSDNQSDKVGMPLIDAAKKEKIRLIVNLTAMGAEHDDTFMLRILEKYVEASGIPYTHLRPNWFMQNFNSGPMLADIRATGTLHLPAADAKLSFIDVRDIAAVGYAALTQPHHVGKAYTLTGKEALSHFQVAEKLSHVAGKTISYMPISEEVARAGLAKSGIPADLIERWTDFYRKIRQGFCSPVSTDVERILGRSPLSFEQYANDYAASWR